MRSFAVLLAGLASLGGLVLLSACGGGAPASQPTAAVEQKASNLELPALPVDSSRVDPAAYEAMLREARLRGAVRVAVSLEPVNLFSPDEAAKAAARAKARVKLEALLAQLGPQLWRHTVFADQTFMGMASMYVTAEGLEILARTDHVTSFFWTSDASRMLSGSGNLEAIDQALLVGPYVDVDVALNIGALDFSFARDGSFRFLPSPEQSQQVKQVGARLLASLYPEHVYGDFAFLGAALMDGPVLKLRITRAGFYALRASGDVLSIRLLGWVDRSPPRIDQVQPEERWGIDGSQIEAILVLRDTPAMGLANSSQGQERLYESSRRTFDDILAPLSDQVVHRNRATEGAGWARVALTPAGYARLWASPDPRLGAVSLNRPLGGLTGN